MIPLLLIVGTSGSGKTTLIEKLIPELKHRGYRIGVIKHTHHELEADCEKKDSRRHLDAGAELVMLSSRRHFTMIKAPANDRLPELTSYFREVDLIITEGFKSETGTKIEVIRSATGKKPIYNDASIDGWIALVADSPLETPLPCFEPHEITRLADFIENRILKPQPA